MFSGYSQQYGAKYRFSVAGRINDDNFHKCLDCLKYLEQKHYPQIVVQIETFFET